MFGLVVRDARSLSSEAQAELRRTAVRLVAEGRSMTEVGELLGVARETVGRWVKVHSCGGDQALDARRRGRRPGHTKLTDAQQLQVAKLVAGKDPDQLKLGSPLDLVVKPGPLDPRRPLPEDLSRASEPPDAGPSGW